MKEEFIRQFRTIGKLQTAVKRAETLHEALHDSLHILLDASTAENAIVWHVDDNDPTLLRPEYWLCPIDITGKTCRSGEGMVGKAFAEEAAYKELNYVPGTDPQMDRDFHRLGIGSVVCVPMATENELIGVIQFINGPDAVRFTEDDADTFEILTTMISMEIGDNEKLQKPWKMGKVVISARDIKKEFVNNDIVTKVLHGVNMDIYEGEFVAVLGESGCGKSTFLNIVGGMDKATSGSFTFNGKDMSNATDEELTDFRRDNIGFIFQSYNLMPNLTAKQNLDLIAELVEDPMDSEEALKLVGLGDRKDNYPSQLSGGQQQRVSIARALVKRPGVIFADEPTAALDYATSIEVLQVMEEVIKQGTTLVMVTHNEEITRMADRVVRMRRGKMFEVLINRHPAKATDLVW